MNSKSLRLYSELASWWHLFSPPSHYVEEAEDLLPRLLAAPDAPPATLLELGCGGGSLASHLKSSLDLTLTDRSPQMLEISRAVNPECRHVLGDMRSIDLGEEFDLVFIHDAIVYATDAESVQATLDTARRHCRAGGGVCVVPDFVKETFEASTSTGGEDGANGQGLRYLQWTWDPDAADTTYDVAYAFLLREADGTVRVDSDLHREGIFPRAMWLQWLDSAGFTCSCDLDRWQRDVFVGRKRR